MRSINEYENGNDDIMPPLPPQPSIDTNWEPIQIAKCISER